MWRVKKSFKKLNFERINFAFLDGSHTYYDLKSEFEFTAKRQYKSDIIIIDDYDDQYKGLKKQQISVAKHLIIIKHL